MSNRTQDQITAEAEMRLSHIAQIEALTTKGLSEQERVRRFGNAAGFDEAAIRHALQWLPFNSAARAVWLWGSCENSLFGNLPGCRCPTYEGLPGVPRGDVPHNWRPDAAQLEVFSRIQLERRFGSRGDGGMNAGD